MSYKISYCETRVKKKVKPWLRLMVASMLAISLGILARFYYPEETKQIREALFPLTADSSRHALRAFSENIRSGESIGDAVTAFCWEIIHESNIS